MPARLADLKRALATFGVAMERPGGGSHWRATRDGLTYPVPAHNGERTEIAEIYIRGLCRCFEIDREDLRRLL